MELKDLKGTRTYLPEEQIIREKIKEVLVSNFKKYGFRPIETSILDFYEIGASKYAGGEEILKEVYRLKDQGGRDLILRYELTFKLAKLIGMNPRLRMPFKRYEIGKVFRDGPIKAGRLREFTQCDVDTVGVKDTYADFEFIKMANSIFKDLKIDVEIEVSSRNFLFGFMEFCGINEKDFVSVALSLDKIKKFGRDYVEKELRDKGIDEDAIVKLLDFLEKGSSLSNQEAIKFFESYLQNECGKQGIKELKELFDLVSKFKIENVKFNPSLARGLGYYTGLIWEVFPLNSKVTSTVAAGGRWDKMIQNFIGSKEEYPATGMTFGLDVIYEVLKERGFEDFKETIPKVLVIPIQTLDKSIEVVETLRENGISTDLVNKKLTKALEFADKRGVPYVLICGKTELSQNKVKLRDMKTGEEKLIDLDKLVAEIKNLF